MVTEVQFEEKHRQRRLFESYLLTTESFFAGDVNTTFITKKDGKCFLLFDYLKQTFTEKIQGSI
jgi:hypothetical protein